jgi:hypothetical protein
MSTPRADKRFFLFAGLALALGTLALYWPLTDFSFINFDDDEYVYDNPVVRAGLTWPGVRWAFGGIHVGNWHPLAWLSHMLDCQLFGLNAGGHHLVSVLFHAANALLLFALLRSLTGAQWRSAAVAALFAWHPLHVESVAWIAERKDVLCAFFWLLALMAYVRYVGNSKLKTKNSKLFYALALLCCAAALLSKPMAVTLPFTLLLLDCWPLGRIQDSGFRIQNFKTLLLEKIPFFILSLGTCAVALGAQRGVGAVSGVDWSSRVGNATVGYARYLTKLFWPTDMTVVYPYVYRWPAAAIFGSALLLALVSALAVISFRRKPWLAVGWFWFLGTLVPVIGFVQVGMQSMADRYSYVPGIGIFIIVVWGASEICLARPDGKIILSLLGGGALLGCVLPASVQVLHWRDGKTVFLHALDVTRDNYVAANKLGQAFAADGDDARALALYREAVRIEPRYAVSQYNLGLALLAFGDKDGAFTHLAAAARLDAGNAGAQFSLGRFFLRENHLPEAAQCLKAAVKAQPDFPGAKAALDALLAAHPELK